MKLEKPENNSENQVEQSPDHLEKFLEEIHYEILGKITLVRHGATEYTNKYPDLTELGKEQAKETGAKIKEKINYDQEEISILASPMARAHGTADIIRGELEYDKEAKLLRSLRGLEVRDREKALAMIMERVSLLLAFRGETREAVFDRRSRAIEILRT